MSGVPPITFSKDTSVAKRNEASTKYHGSLSTILIILNFYRPQRSWDKVILQHFQKRVSRILFTVGGGGGGVCRPTPGGGWGVWLGSPGSHPGGRLWGLAGGISRPRGGVCIPACTEADTPLFPADGYCCWRYASYWNTFLYFLGCSFVTFPNSENNGVIW